MAGYFRTLSLICLSVAAAVAAGGVVFLGRAGALQLGFDLFGLSLLLVVISIAAEKRDDAAAPAE